jgi:hypothetical protein
MRGQAVTADLHLERPSVGAAATTWPRARGQSGRLMHVTVALAPLAPVDQVQRSRTGQFRGSRKSFGLTHFARLRIRPVLEHILNRSPDASLQSGDPPRRDSQAHSRRRPAHSTIDELRLPSGDRSASSTIQPISHSTWPSRLRTALNSV